MNLLLVYLEFPYPPHDGGRSRMYNLLRQAAKNHQVTLVCFKGQDFGEENFRFVGELCQEVLLVSRPDPPSRGWADKVRDAWSFQPVGLKSWYSSELEEILCELVKKKSFDLVQFDQVLLAQYSPSIRPLPWILVHHNVEALSQSRQLTDSQPRSFYQKLSGTIERKRWQRYEIAMSRRARAIVAVSEQEAQYFKKHVPPEKVFVAPNGVDLDYFKPVERSAPAPCLLFTGRMDYPPNVDAMGWFCRDIWPALRRVKPGLQLLVVGRDPTPEIVELGALNGITVTGMVEDVRPYFARSSLFIVPLRSGGGTRLKILEAMAMGMPVVSTNLGCEGLDVEDGQHILVGDGAAQFTAQVLRLLDSQALQMALGERGRLQVVEKYGWEKTGRCMQAAYEYAVRTRIE